MRKYVRSVSSSGRPYFTPCFFASKLFFSSDRKNRNDNVIHAKNERHDSSLSSFSAAAPSSSSPWSSSSVPNGSPSRFWTHDVPAVPLSQLKSEYGAARTTDRRSRFRVRGALREDGVISNFYPLNYPKERSVALQDAPIYIYEMRAFRTATLKKSRDIDTIENHGVAEKDLGFKKGNAPEERGSQDVRDRSDKSDEKRRKGKWNKSGDDSPFSSPVETEIVLRPIHPSAVWDAVRRYIFQLYMETPPMVRLDAKLYTTAPLREQALLIPPAYHDVGWDSCELCFLGKHSFCSLALDELQRVVNKIVLWCVRRNAVSAQHAVVREAKGKFVCTELGLRSNGVRVYQGVTVQALFLETSTDSTILPLITDEESRQLPTRHSPRPTDAKQFDDVVPSRDLEEVLPDTPVKPIRLTVHEYIRSFEYKGKKVESYKIEDASGVYLASLWEPAEPKSLVVGSSYLVNRWKLKIYPEKHNMRLFEFQKWSVFTEISRSSTKLLTKDPSPSEPSGSPRDSKSVTGGMPSPPKDTLRTASHFPTTTAVPGSSHGPSLALKIDAKGTVASELSLWEDVRHQFGKGPYDRGTQERIRQAVEGTPIVTSINMQQGILRSVCFDLEKDSEEGRFVRQFLTSDARKLLTKVEIHQPFGLLQDGTLWPLQVLHCCFDPRMKSWQDATISALSLLPAKRVQLLTKFQKMLEGGLILWGLELSDQPWRTKALSLLPTPQKQSDRGYQFQKGIRHPFPSSHPTTVTIIGILESSLREDRETSDSAFATRIRETVDRMGKYFKSNLVTCVKKEADAVEYLNKQLGRQRDGMPTTSQDPNSAAIFITSEKDTRASRWMYAECLSRGVLPLGSSAPRSPKLQALLCGNVKRQLITSFECDPLFGVQIYSEIPTIKGKFILFMGIDTCHTSSHSVGSAVGVFCTPERNHLIPYFWRQEMRGSEVGDVCDAFQHVFQKAKDLYQKVDEVVVFQDGDVFRSMTDLKSEIQNILPLCGFTFMCLHKRGNIRFMHGKGYGGQPLSSVDVNNIVKGSIIEDLTPFSLDKIGDSTEIRTPAEDSTSARHSFYLQSHDGNMSTSRIVHYSVHHSSPTLPTSIVQQLANVMSNVLAPQPTKLPMPTRCAHRLADKAERLLDAVPQLQYDMIPSPLCERLWFF